MKILHLLGATEDTGGVLSVIRGLQTATVGRGHEHCVWVNQAYRETRQPALTYRYSRHLLGDSPSHLRLFLGAARAWTELKALRRQEPFDVLHAHSRGTLVVAVGVAALGREPILFTNHGYGQRLGFYRWAAARPRLFTAVLTPSMARHYRLRPGAPGLAVISACCADRFFSEPLMERRRREPASPAIRLAGVGNIVRWKNWHLLLEAMGQLSEPERGRVEFHHWGAVSNDADSPAYSRELQDLIRRHKLEGKAVFHGPSLAIQTVLREADWFVLPSTNEPCSVALIEALALGLPALASASGGNVDIIQPNRTGVLFQPESADDLARAVRAILSDKPRLATPAELRESVRHRGASVVADQYLEIYRQIALRRVAG